MGSRASESKVERSRSVRAMELARPPREVGADQNTELPSRMPTMRGLGPPSRASSGKLRLVHGGQGARLRVDDNLEESAFFERGDDSEVLGPMMSDRDADPARAVSSLESFRRRAALRRLVAGVVGFASVLAALAAVKAMVGPARGSLEPTPEPTEPIVVVMQRLDPVVFPAAGSPSAAPSAEPLVCWNAMQCQTATSAADEAQASDQVAAAAAPPASPAKARDRRHLAQGRGAKKARPHRPVRSVAPR